MTYCCCRFDGSRRHPGCGAHVAEDVVRILRLFDNGHDFRVEGFKGIAATGITPDDMAGQLVCQRCDKRYPNDPNFSQDPCAYWDNR